ncbi:MAG: hypothetical protein M3438_01615 [Pseudomonadota bacterium]|nr:hypothetical protein [Sphingomonas sp.]MDQ3477849.1 hypothetical protein [Pseudomonadota bacterium]
MRAAAAGSLLLGLAGATEKVRQPRVHAEARETENFGRDPGTSGMTITVGPAPAP